MTEVYLVLRNLAYEIPGVEIHSVCTTEKDAKFTCAVLNGGFIKEDSSVMFYHYKPYKLNPYSPEEK